MKEKLQVSGNVIISIINSKTGEIIEEFNENNKIVNTGFENVAKLIGGNPTASPVTKIGFGESDVEVSVENTKLVNPFIKNIDSVVYPTFNKVRFSFSLSAEEGNGRKITELALLNSAGVMFSRKTRSLITKTDKIIISGIWVITVN